MLHFDGLVYLDVQKTGSTLVTAFLNACCTRRLVHYHQHDRLRSAPAAGTAVVISVREPAAQYLSLFRFGLDRRGGLYHRLRAHDMHEVYQPTQEAFETFVEVLLQPETAPVLHNSFAGAARRFGIGFMTFRHLMLAVRRPLAMMTNLPRDGLMQAYPDQRIWTDVLRQEHLADDLLALAHRHPDLFDAAAARDFLAPQPRINLSSAGADLSADLPPDLMALLRQREDLIYRNFYPEAVGASS